MKVRSIKLFGFKRNERDGNEKGRKWKRKRMIETYSEKSREWERQIM